MKARTKEVDVLWGSVTDGGGIVIFFKDQVKVGYFIRKSLAKELRDYITEYLNGGQGGHE